MTEDRNTTVQDEDMLEMEIREMSAGQVRDGFAAVGIDTSRGEVHGRFYPAPQAKAGVIYVGGAGGGWDTPAGDLYPRICEDLVLRDIAGLRIKYRHPAELDECVLDALAGMTFLEDQGLSAIGMVGWSFGGAAVIQAAAAAPIVRAVVTVATQSYGADAAASLAPRCALLLLHGTSDATLPVSCSEYVYSIAGEPKKLVTYPGANHGLDEVHDEALSEARDWLAEHLNRAAQESLQG